MAPFTGGQRAAARALKAARLRKAFSQRRLAKAAGVAVGVVHNFEAMIDDRGYATWPDDIRRAKLETAVNLPAGELQRIADTYASQADLIDEQTHLEERLSEVHRRQREGLTQEQAEAILRRNLLILEATRRRVELLRAAVEEQRKQDAIRLTEELEDLLKGPGPNQDFRP